MVLPRSPFNSVENLTFIEHLISWFTNTDEIHENLYPMKINESTVLLIAITKFQHFIHTIKTALRLDIISVTTFCHI